MNNINNYIFCIIIWSFLSLKNIYDVIKKNDKIEKKILDIKTKLHLKILRILMIELIKCD